MTPSLMMVNPALQNPEIAWKQEKNIISPMDSKFLGLRELNISIAPISSNSSVMKMMVSNVDMTELSLFSPNISPNMSWFLKENPPEKKYPKNPVKVMIPSPPICMSAMITDCPKREKLVDISVVESPVMHTALVAIKKASTKLRGASVVVRGSINRKAPNTISPRKLTTNKMVGLK